MARKSKPEERKPNVCNEFKDSDKIFEFINEPLCKHCGWAKNEHHNWRRMQIPNGLLGLGWFCMICGMTAYDKDGKCDTDIPPIDYLPCGTWTNQSYRYRRQIMDEAVGIRAGIGSIDNVLRIIEENVIDEAIGAIEKVLNIHENHIHPQDRDTFTKAISRLNGMKRDGF